MSRLRAVIIDDEETGIEILKLLLEKHAQDVKVVGQATRGIDGIELIETYMPEIVFLDISMPEMDGFEIVEKLSWKKFHLIFTTAYQEHGLRALKLSASNYLLKPVDYEDLAEALEKVKDQVLADQRVKDSEYALLNELSFLSRHKLAISSKHGVEYINPQEIVYLESRSNYTLIQASGTEAILTPKTLGDFEGQLCNNSHFMRVHHSYVVNLHKVVRYVKEQDVIIMANEQKIPLSKSRKPHFLKWLSQ